MQTATGGWSGAGEEEGFARAAAVDYPVMEVPICADPVGSNTSPPWDLRKLLGLETNVSCSSHTSSTLDEAHPPYKQCTSLSPSGNGSPVVTVVTMRCRRAPRAGC